MENQCLGLAEAMGLSPLLKRIQTKKPWRWLPPQLWINPLAALKAEGDPLDAPWPDMVISCGRQAIPLSIAIKKASGGATFTVHIQTPNCAPGKFDMVIVPFHDKMRGPNVSVSEGSLTRITKDKLAAEYKKFANELEAIKASVVTVLVGGSNKCYSVTPAVMQDLCAKLEQLHAQEKCHFLVTTSRRTGPANEAILKAALSKLPHSLWSGDGANPYFAYLEKADAIIVTADSVNMVCEAATSGKPTYIYELQGSNPKFARFHKRMKDMGFTRKFEGTFSDWKPEKLSESQRLAQIVWSKFDR
jgi:mitochondrial fission protein ELM1